MLTWLRSLIRDTVLSGFQDALLIIERDAESTRPAVEALEARMRPALAPPPEEKARGRKGGGT